MINLREIILGALMDIVEEEQYSHIVLKDVLEKYQYQIGRASCRERV